MKKLLTIFFVFIAFQAFSKKVTISQATNVAINWINEKFDMNYQKSDISEVLLEKQGQTEIYYILIFKDKGWVIVSADDIAIPVIAYSNQSMFLKTSQTEAYIKWMSNIKKDINYSIELHESQLEDTKKEWQKYSIESKRFKKSINNRSSVSPLLQTKWNQGRKYNDFCPNDSDGPGGRAYAGCVATAMSQILKYHNFPEQGYGKHSYTPYNHPEYGVQYVNFGNTTYNWNSMSLTSSNSDVALLMYHCGVSVEMNYGPDGSGANVSSKARKAFVNYFKYDESIRFLSKENYSDLEWQNLVLAELNEGRPILYRGRNPKSGHAFVLDGYQAQKYFHFNWGWGGYLNGYFYLDDITPGTRNYNLDQGGLFNIKPSKDPTLSFRYFQSFEDDLPLEWSFSGDRISLSELESSNGSKSLLVGTTNGIGYDISSALLGINVTSPMILSFKVKRGYSPATSNYNTNSVFIREQFGNTILHEFFNQDFNDSEWQTFSLDLSPYVGQNIILGFKQANYSSSYKQWMYVDDIEIESKVISIGSISNTNIQVTETEGTNIDISYIVEGTFTKNSFSAYLSDSNGDFQNEQKIGSIQSDTNEILSVLIPAGTVTGEDYKIRLKSSNPQVISDSMDLSIELLKIKTGIISDTTCYVTNTTGANINIPFTLEGTFDNNDFSAYLSDKTGDFQNEQKIGTLKTDSSSIISAFIPEKTESGTKYRIRIKYNSPKVTSDTSDYMNVEFVHIKLSSLTHNVLYVSPDSSAKIKIPFVLKGNIPMNTFIAFLSDKNGKFENKLNIGRLETDSSGTVSAIIPEGTISGTGYKVKIKSSLPETFSDESEQFEIKLIDTRPNITVSSSEKDTTILKIIPVNVTFSSDVEGFELEDLVLINCTVNNFVKKTSENYIFDVTPKDRGLIKVEIPENIATNVLDNGNKSGNWSILFRYPDAVDNILLENIEIYPNPTNDIVFIKNSNKDIVDKIIIKDISGKSVLNYSSFVKDKTLNLQELRKGVYLIQLYFKEKIVTKKVVLF